MATEQQRIANALQAMAGIEPSKANETEQQRIAAAVEALAQGGGGSTGGVMLVHKNGIALDKTWQEIFDAIKSGMLVMFNSVTETEDFTSANNEFIQGADYVDNTFNIYIGVEVYSTDSSDGYPKKGIG